jgi:hypothetical protein
MELPTPPPSASHSTSRKRGRAGSRRPQRVTSQLPTQAVAALAAETTSIIRGSRSEPETQKATMRPSRMAGQYWRPASSKAASAAPTPGKMGVDERPSVAQKAEKWAERK